MPFAGFKDFNDCVAKQKEKNPKLTDSAARAICATIEKRSKEKHNKEKEK